MQTIVGILPLGGGKSAKIRVRGVYKENKIRFYREYEGLSQREVARRVRISSTEMSNIERGVKLPNVMTAIRIAKVLRVTVEALWEAEK